MSENDTASPEVNAGLTLDQIESRKVKILAELGRLSQVKEQVTEGMKALNTSLKELDQLSSLLKPPPKST